MNKSLKQILDDVHSLKVISSEQSTEIQKQSTLINQLTNYVNKKTSELDDSSMDSLEEIKKGIEINSIHLQILNEKHKFLYANLIEIYSKIDLISETLADMLTRKKNKES